MNARRKETKDGGHANHHLERLTSLEARVTRLEQSHIYIHCVLFAFRVIVYLLS